MTFAFRWTSLGLYLDGTEATAAVDFVRTCLRVQTAASVILLAAMLLLHWRGRSRPAGGGRVHLLTTAIALFAVSTISTGVLLGTIFRDGDHSPMIWLSFLTALGCALLAGFGRGPARWTALAGGLLMALSWAPFLYAFAVVPGQVAH